MNWALLEWHAQEAQRVSAHLQITIEPTRSPSEFSTIPDEILDKLARMCFEINTKYGTPVYLRFGHEMNVLVCLRRVHGLCMVCNLLNLSWDSRE